MWHLVSRGTCGAFLLRFAFSFAETVRDGRGKKSADAKKRVYVTFCVNGKERPKRKDLPRSEWIIEIRRSRPLERITTNQISCYGL